MTSTGTARRLVLLRHAKAKRPLGVPDHDRPLAGRGRRDAQAAGRWFAQEGPRPDLVLCSTAARTRQTWQIVARASGLAKRGVEVRHRGELYAAGTDAVLAELRAVADEVRVLVVVGHEPAASGVALRLAGPASDALALATLDEKYPTCGIAVLGWSGPWGGLADRSADLLQFVVPRG